MTQEEIIKGKTVWLLKKELVDVILLQWTCSLSLSITIHVSSDSCVLLVIHPD